jgi:hypothetical protein
MKGCMHNEFKGIYWSPRTWKTTSLLTYYHRIAHRRNTPDSIIGLSVHVVISESWSILPGNALQLGLSAAYHDITFALPLFRPKRHFAV